jgi:hypothetical protein
VPPDDRLLEGKFRRPAQPTGSTEADDGVGDDEGDTYGDDDSTGEGGDQGSKGGPAPGEAEVNVPLRIFMDPKTDSRYLIHGELPEAGQFAIYLYAFGDDGKRDPIEIERPRVRKDGDRWAALQRKSSNAIGPIAASGKGSVQIDFKVSSRVRLTVSSRVTKYAD